jgi:hypothetical protein
LLADVSREGRCTDPAAREVLVGAILAGPACGDERPGASEASEAVVSAKAVGNHPIIDPAPSATASAPTRPKCLGRTEELRGRRSQLAI